MKELSIEEKARAYDEALSVAQETYTTQPMYRDWLAKMFPELKENEDERIKREIINYLSTVDDKELIPYESWIAWLEKQNKQKLVEKYNITGIGSKNAQGKLGEMIKNLKSADKVEPKFKIGDWIITNKNHIWYVDETPETTSYLYRLINQYGKVEVAEFEVVDNAARLWTIQDAKDGDVLVTGGVIFIFNKIHGVWLNCHCSLHKDGSFNNGDYDLITDKYFSEVYPATKEQRDALFSKMKEAGYEWDVEKKKN